MEPWRAGTSNKVVVPARQAGNRSLGSLKGLQIRALYSPLDEKLDELSKSAEYFFLSLLRYFLKPFTMTIRITEQVKNSLRHLFQIFYRTEILLLYGKVSISSFINILRVKQCCY